MKILSGLLVTISVFFAPVAPIMVMVGMAIILDTFFGRRCARVLAEREGKDPNTEVSSRKTRVDTTVKMLTYQAVILLLYMIDRYITNDVTLAYFPQGFLVTKVTGLYLIYIEYLSIEEKVYKMNGYLITDKIKDFFKKIKNIFKMLVDFRK